MWHWKYILFMLLCVSCRPLSDNEDDFVGNREGGKAYQPYRDGHVELQDSSVLRIPTMQEWQALFALPHQVVGSDILFVEKGDTLTLPLCGYTVNERELVLYGTMASYLTSDGHLFRVRKGGNGEMMEEAVENDGTYNSLRMVSDKKADGMVKIGSLYWKRSNESTGGQKKVSYYLFYANDRLDIVSISIQ